MPLPNVSYLYLSCFALTLLAGCGSGPADLPDLAPVSGAVTLDGQPLSKAVIQFVPDAGGRSSTATTDDQGHYELLYTSDYMGASLGKHKVTISTGEGEAMVYPEGVDPDTLNEAEQRKYASEQKDLPARYNAKTELTAEIVAGENTHDFKLTSD